MINRRLVIDDSVLDINAVDLWTNTVGPALSKVAEKMAKEDEIFSTTAEKMLNCIPSFLNDGDYNAAVEQVVPFINVVGKEYYFKKYPHLEDTLKKEVTELNQKLMNFMAVCNADKPPVQEEKEPRHTWQEGQV